MNEEYFKQHFFDARLHKPQPGQILAIYTAMASLVKSQDKRELLELLGGHDTAIAASQMMKKIFLADERDSVRVPRQICEDLQKGMTFEQVLKKKYKFRLQMFFYVLPEFFPVDDVHWSTVSLLNVGKS